MHLSRTSCILMVVAGLLVSGALIEGTRQQNQADRLYRQVADVMDREHFDNLEPIHQRILNHLADSRDQGLPRAACCWADGSYDAATMTAFNAIIQGSAGDFQLAGRWSSTSGSGGGLGQGDPTIIRYSFVPDGTTVPSGTGEPSGTSQLFSWMNGIYGNQATWQNIFHQVFQDWGDLCGIIYIHETNDDGSTLFGAGGLVGVRGDVRISAKSIDGNSGILAYNFFPSGGGDMVLDAFDSFYNSTSNNSRRLRNTVAHEHGHGMGLLHVCPSNSTKLMEPFISTSYDGPQHDDIQGAQRHYGDFNERNDQASTATSLGSFGNGNHAVSGNSLDDNSDTDWFSFSVTGSKQVSITLSPVGQSYTQGAQTGSCNGGSTYNSSTANNLAVDVRDTNGSTVLASVDSGPAGSTENLPATPLPSGAGTYYIRVYGGTANNVQLYSMTVNISDYSPPLFDITFPNGVPAAVPPGQTTDVLVRVTDTLGSHDPSSGQLLSSLDGGVFLASPLTSLGGGDFNATLSGLSCYSTLGWYVSFGAQGSSVTVTGPTGAPTVSNTTTGLSTSVFDDNFNANMGWIVTNDAALTDGAWQRGIPAGGGDRGDPAADSDGSGFCFVTDNADGNSDVDGGTTTLTSPPFDLTAFNDVRMSFDFWYDNDFGGNPNSDNFVMQITDDGTNWVTFETYNNNTDIWNAREIDPSLYVNMTTTVQVRFAASDLGGGSVVEAGVDAFRISACTGTPPGPSLPTTANGNLGIGAGGPFNTLLINGSAGLPDRRVDVGIGQAFTLQLSQSPTTTNPSNFAIWGYIGVPEIMDLSLISGVGVMAFEPCTINPSSNISFTLTNNFGPDPCGQFAGSTPTPWTLNVPGLGFPFTVTFQGVVDDSGTIRITNGIILRII